MYLITYIIYVNWNLKINLIYDVIPGQHNNMAIKKVWNNFIDFKGRKKKKKKKSILLQVYNTEYPVRLDRLFLFDK